MKNISSDRWFDLCERLGIKNDLAHTEHDFLVAQYSDKGRAYHDLNHIDFVVGMLELYRPNIANFDLSEFDAWEHDSIMHFRRRPRGYPRDEALSGVNADGVLVKSGKPYECRVQSFSQIMVTTHEEDRARSFDEMVLADIDWSPLGLPWEAYLENRAKIRHEWREVSDTDFQNARLAWVAKACRRKSHFYLPEFKMKYDGQTQANLTRELAEFRIL